jgi:long-subunit fatty acid transport protein
LPTDATFFSEEKGGVDQIDFNLSCNINDRLYLGATFGVQYVDYQRSSIYEEFDDYGTIYTLDNWQKTEGAGFDVKLGAIVRPFEYSPFRLGLAFHLPTFYNLTDYSNAYIAGPEIEGEGYREMATVWPEAYGEDYIVDYSVSSPWRMNVSAGYTFDNFLAFNAEYEYVNYSSANMEYTDGTKMPDMEEEFESNMQSQNILRLGAEMRLDDNFSMRFGYNYISSAFREDAWKYISPSSATTATDYTNIKDTNLFTLGLGYRGKSIYFDAAYQCAIQDAEFFTYKDPEISLPATEVSNFQNKLIFTLGVRF